MKFYVISGDGQKYGPADIQTLNQWIQEGRLNPTSELEDADTGLRQLATNVYGLVFPPAAQAPPGGGSSTFSQQVQTSQPGSFIDPPTASPYPRPTHQPHVPGTTPVECRGGFNFGAFFFSWIWGLNHKAYITLIVLAVSCANLIPVIGVIAPFANLGLAIWFGIKGNEWAWQSGRFATPQDCLACQKIWMWWGLGFLIVGCLGGFMVGFAGAFV